MIEHHLRPLFGFFEALSMPTVIYASEADFMNGKIYSDPVLRRIELAVKQMHQVIRLRLRQQSDAERDDCYNYE